MKTRLQISIFRTAVIAAVSALLFELNAAGQSVPSLINYQGRLTGQTGAPLTAGSYVIQFRLWNDPTASSPANLIWSQQQTVTVQTNGVFDVILGAPAGSAISGDSPAVTNVASAFGSSNAFLGVTVTFSNGVAISSPSEILPRQQLLSVPFAVQAQSAMQAQVSFSLVTNLAYALCPAGSVMAYMGTIAPPGWLMCDGSLVSRSQYAALFSIIGTSSGSGDNSTTFDLPDLRAMFLRGVTGSRSDSFADPDVASRSAAFAGGNAGNAVASIQMDMFASHTHDMAGSSGGTVYQADQFVGGRILNSGAYPTGGTGGNETRSKNVYVNYIIKY